MSLSRSLPDFTAQMQQIVPAGLKTFGEARFSSESDLCALTFAPDGTVWSVDEAGLLKHWSSEGRLLSRAFLSDLETVWLFSPKADILASGNDDLLFWDTAEGQLISRLPQQSWVTALGYSHQGDLLLTGHDNGTVKFWDVRSQRCVGEIAAHNNPISAVAVNAQGTFVATAGEDRIIRIWDAITHQLVKELSSHTDRIPALTWSADGQYLVSAGWDTSARVWKPLETDEPLMLLNSHADQVVAAQFHPGLPILATADSDHDVHLWANPEKAELQFVLRGHVNDIRSIVFNNDGTRLATAGNDRVIHVWDTATGKLLAGPNPTGRHALAYIPGATPHLASTGRTNVRVWNLDQTQEVELPFVGQPHALAASHDGKWLAVAGLTHQVQLFDMANPVKPIFLEATKPPVGALAFSPTGSMLAQASPTDGLLWLWQPETATDNPGLIIIEAADGCTLESVAIHPNHDWVAVGGVDVLSTGERDGAVCIWSASSKEKIQSYDVGVYHLAFDPKGRFLAGAGLNDRVLIWDLAEQKQAFSLEGHQQRVNCVAFSPDGSYLVSCGDDGTLRVWDVLSGRVVVIREFDAAVQSVVFSPDGQMLFTGNADTTCYQVNFAELLND